MDGYSVQDAASVLGVAEGRVWELLARGVLVGTPEGDSMRVFLKAQPAPMATAARDEPPRTNGNGGTPAPEGEASAFRELLTEFRNLTERYGQALLALGEARGEVAGLRSRVDLLEARLDVRMPTSFEAAPVTWESTTIPAAPSQEAPPPAPVVRPSRTRKARSPHDATAGFADALARALDPTAAELPPATETDASAVSAEAAAPPVSATPEVPEAPEEPAVMVAAATDEAPEPMEERGTSTPEGADEHLVADEAPTVEAVEPAVEAVEPAVEVAEPAAPTYSAVVVEPDWFADGDFAWLEAADLEANAAPEAAAAAAAAEPEPAAEPELPPEQEPPIAAALEPPPPMAAPEPEPPSAPAPEPLQAAELPVLPEPELPSEPEFPAEPPAEPPAEAPTAATQGADIMAMSVGGADFETWQPSGPAVSGSPDAGAAAAGVADAPDLRPMGTAVAIEEEVMWLGSEPSAITADEPRLEVRPEPEPWPTVNAAPPAADVVRPPLAMTEDELARLALDEGWDESEVAAIRAMITPIPSARVDLPGAAELHEAMAALEAVPVQVDPANDASRQWAKPTAEDQQRARREDWVFGAEPAPPPAAAPRPPSDVTSALRRSISDPGWLQRGQGPAAAAYRRLRRLFPG